MEQLEEHLPFGFCARGPTQAGRARPPPSGTSRFGFRAKGSHREAVEHLVRQRNVRLRLPLFHFPSFFVFQIFSHEQAPRLGAGPREIRCAWKTHVHRISRVCSDVKYCCCSCCFAVTRAPHPGGIGDCQATVAACPRMGSRPLMSPSEGSSMRRTGPGLVLARGPGRGGTVARGSCCARDVTWGGEPRV